MLFKRKIKYEISIDGDEWVAPEETLLDSSSQYSDIEKPIPASTFRFFMVIFGIIILTLSGFFFKTTILDHEVYASLSFQNKSANFSLAPPRGMILDAYGQPLLQNIPIFNLLAVTRELRDNSDKLEEILIMAASILDQDADDFINSTKDQMKTNSVFFLYRDLTKEQALEFEYNDLAGLYIVPNTKREYISGQKLSQIIGYTGKVNKEDLLNDDYYFTTDTIGRLGIEHQYEEYLRGDHGSIFFSREEGGYITKEPLAGETLMLNIDKDLQIKFYDSTFEVLRESGLSRAAGIIQDPKTGAVLSMISFPSFDNNIFSSNVSENDYKRLFENSERPLFNRVIGGLYNPGSTIKPYIGMTARQENIISSNFTIRVCISLTVPNPYNPESPYIFRNWRAEQGFFDLKKSIANSCNIFFFIAGGGHENIKGLGAEKLTNYLKDGLASSLLDIDIPGESKGLIPSPDWKLLQKGEPWYLGDTYNTSIGQGDLLVTPLWINSYISAIANGGTIFKPRIAEKTIGNNDAIIEQFNTEKIKDLPFSKEVINEMKEAMRETVISGTAQTLNNLPVKAAAKTGTAEVIKGKSINSLFTVFAPYDNPEISMTILVEGSASNQGLAIRIAYDVLNWYFNRNTEAVQAIQQ